MRISSEVGAPSLDRLIDAAQARGIIDEQQAVAMRALAGELAQPRPAEAPTEERRAFNPVIIAYAIGALLVLFALGWFLADRWRDLGAGGVLAVSVIYASAFAITAWMLRQRGFRVAGGLAATLAVAMTPVWAWALLHLTGEWPLPNDYYDPLTQYPPWRASRWIILELATIGVALATLRQVRFFTMGVPLATGFVALMLHLGQALGDPRLSWYVGPFYGCVVACVTLAVAYVIDRRQEPGEDYALWFYLAGCITLVPSYIGVWNSIGYWRHALPLVAAVFVIAALYLQRRVLLLAGGVAAFGYLGYLAFDVFRRVVALPMALAALGLLVIATTVWVQRKFPVLVARVSRTQESSKKLPTGLIAVLGPVAIAVTAMLFAVREAEERTLDREWMTRYYNRIARHAQMVERRAAEKRAADSTAATLREQAR